MNYSRKHGGNPHMIGVKGTEYIHYIKTTGKYQITRKINGSTVSFGNYPSLTEAIKYRDHFQKNNWNLTERLHYSKSKYIIQLPSGKYNVVKQKNGTKISYGTFDTLKEAEHQVKLCKTFNWDTRLKPFDCMKYIQKRKTVNGYHYRIIRTDSHDTQEYYGTFHNLDDAKYERDLLLLCDWDYEKLSTMINEGDTWLKGKLNTRVQFYRQPHGRIDYDKDLLQKKL